MARPSLSVVVVLRLYCDRDGYLACYARILARCLDVHGCLEPPIWLPLLFSATAWALSILKSYRYIIIPIGIFSGLSFHAVLSIVARLGGGAIEP